MFDIFQKKNSKKIKKIFFKNQITLKISLYIYLKKKKIKYS